MLQIPQFSSLKTLSEASADCSLEEPLRFHHWGNQLLAELSWNLISLMRFLPISFCNSWCRLPKALHASSISSHIAWDPYHSQLRPLWPCCVHAHGSLAPCSWHSRLHTHLRLAPVGTQVHYPAKAPRAAGGPRPGPHSSYWPTSPHPAAAVLYSFTLSRFWPNSCLGLYSFARAHAWPLKSAHWWPWPPKLPIGLDPVLTTTTHAGPMLDAQTIKMRLKAHHSGKASNHKGRYEERKKWKKELKNTQKTISNMVFVSPYLAIFTLNITD